MFKAIVHEVLENMGGNNRLFVCPAHLINMPDSIDQLITDAITFNAGGEWFEIKCVEDTLQARQADSASNQGESITTTINGIVAKNTLDSLQATFHLLGVPMVAFVADNNGINRLCGSKEEPLYISTNRTTGGQAADRNQISITLEGDSIAGWNHMNAPVSVSINTNGELEFDNSSDPTLDAYINNAGELVLSGPNANLYELDTNGNLIYNG